MALHPTAIRIVAQLIATGRAGAKPFGVPLAVWREAIAKLEAEASPPRLGEWN